MVTEMDETRKSNDWRPESNAEQFENRLKKHNTQLTDEKCATCQRRLTNNQLSYCKSFGINPPKCYQCQKWEKITNK